MVTQLKNLKFSDYTLKGETNSSGTYFVLGSADSFGYIETTPGGGSGEYHPIIDAVGSGGVDYWAFRGTADKAVTVTCYSYEDPSSEAGTYKLLVNGSGAVSATPV